VKVLYVSSEILNWGISISSSTIGDISKHNRPYEMISHSEALISATVSDFDLADAIANLKRALNHRLHVIESYYNLKKIKFKGMPKGYLEILEKYGLAKPFLIKKLMEIRNKIEHQDAKPPKIERCKELIDVTWYFLKSTDRLILYIAHHIQLEPNNSNGLSEKYGCTIELSYSKKKMSLSGWIPINYVSKKPVNNFFKINCSTIHDGSYWKGKDDKFHKDKTKDDIWLIGNLSINDDDKHIILHKSFEAY
jgi:hypothetical protein